MSRRDFITLLGAATVAWPLGARAQQAATPKAPLVGFITAAVPNRAFERAFLDGLREAGYTPGLTVEVEFFSAPGNLEEVRLITNGLLNRRVDIIVTGGGNVARVVRQLTTAVPVIFAADSDPTKEGLVASLARPGGNTTGLSVMAPELAEKRFEFLRDLVPRIARIGIILNVMNPGATAQRETIKRVAQSTAFEVVNYDVRARTDIERTFAEAASAKIEGLIVLRDYVIESNRELITELAGKHRVPTIYEQRDFVEAGGLISYGPDLRDLHRRAAHYVARILKGAKPADLPIEQPTKFELVINLKTAKALGLTIPPSVLVRADEIIQ